MDADRKTPLRVGIIGLGAWGRRVAGAALQCPNDLHVVAVASSQPDATSTFGSAYPKARQYAYYEELLYDLALEGVIISTPLHSHFDLVETALKQNLAVFVEKPFVPTLNEVTVLTALWQEQKKPAFFVNYQQLYNRTLQLALESLPNPNDTHFCFSARHGGPGPVRSDCSAFMDYAVHNLAVLNALWSDEPFEIRNARQTEDGKSTSILLACDAYCLELAVSNDNPERVHTWECSSRGGTDERPEPRVENFNLDLRVPQDPSPLHLALTDWSKVARGLVAPKQWHTPEFSIPIHRHIEKVEAMFNALREFGVKSRGEKMQ